MSLAAVQRGSGRGERDAYRSHNGDAGRRRLSWVSDAGGRHGDDLLRAHRRGCAIEAGVADGTHVRSDAPGHGGVAGTAGDGVKLLALAGVEPGGGRGDSEV